MRAFILAGGFATRLWPLTERRAKPLLPLAGTPLLTRIVRAVPAHIPITVSTNAAFEEDFKRWKSAIIDRDVTLRIEQTASDDAKLGTLGATMQWIDAENIDDDILLLTGDNEFGFDMNAFVNRFDGSALVAAHDIGDAAKASAFGVLTVAADGTTVTTFQEKPANPASSLVSTGCSILPRSAIPDLRAYAKVKPDNVGGIFEELLRLGRPVRCFTFTEPWFDVGSFESYLDATRALAGKRTIKDGATVAEDVCCEGSVVIGKGSHVANSELRDTVIFENCTIDDCILENCVIDDGCVLRGMDLTGKMLRAGTRLERT